MPKTNEKDAYFFSHDCNARNDPKILALRSIYGAEGYGVYFMLIEILREQPEYKLPITKYIWNTLAMQMQMEASKLEQIITDCCTEFSDGGNNTLLVNDGEYLYSASLLRRMGKPMTDRAKKLMLTELRKLSEDREEQIAILDQSVKRSWAGVFALKDDRGYQQPRGGRQQASTGEKMGALRNLHDAFSGEGER